MKKIIMLLMLLTLFSSKLSFGEDVLYITRVDNNAITRCDFNGPYFHFDFDDGASFDISYDGDIIATSEMHPIEQYSETFGVCIRNFSRTSTKIEFDLIDGEYSMSEFAHYETIPPTFDGDFIYASSEKNILIGYVGNEENITIPNSVTSIGYNAFLGCSGLTSVNIPSSVTSIGSYAFSGCSGLTSVNIPEPVTSIGENAFRNCSGLTSVTFAEDSKLTSIGSGAFLGCSSLTSVTFAEDSKLTSIGSYAFYDCSGLTSINIPSSVTSIGENAFRNCSGLTSIVIPNSVTAIGQFAFEFCYGLTSIVIPNSVTLIGRGALNRSGLTSIVLEDDNPRYVLVDGILYNKDITELILCPKDKSGVVNIPNTVTCIDYGAFAERTGVTLVNIPNSVTSIGDYAFCGCSGLTSINIPSSVTRIGDNAFEGCSGLTSVNIPESVTSIGWDAFKGCSNLKKVDYQGIVSTWLKITFGNDYANPLYYAHHLYINNEEVVNLVIPETIAEIKPYAFKGCSGLTSVTISNSVTSIGYRAFEDCSGLTSINIPSSVTRIGDNAFEGCSGLTSLIFAENSNLKNIGNGAIKFCVNLASVEIPNSVTSIGYNAFSDCHSLVSVVIPNSVTDMGTSVFENCTSLTSVTISNNVTEIKDCSFRGCRNLTSITIPNSVTSIGWGAFAECYDGFPSINIPSSVTSISDYAFGANGRLMSVIVNWKEPISIGDNVFYYKQGRTLYVPKGTKAKYETTDVWKEFNIVEEPFNPVILSINSDPCGEVSGSGMYAMNETVVISAIPNIGYHFSQWSDGNTDNPRTLTLTQDTNLIANFVPDKLFSISLLASHGIVNGAGKYDYKSNIEIEAIPNEGYYFVKWSNGSVNAKETITIVSDTTITAFFASIDKVVDTLYISSVDTLFMSTVNTLYISSVDTLYMPLVDTVYVSSTDTLFVSSADTLYISDTIFVSSTDTLFISTKDTVYITNKDAVNYSVTTASSNQNRGFAIGAGKYETGTVAEIVAISNYGYHFTTWSDGNTANPRYDTITKDMLYVANFEPNIYGVKAEPNDKIMGSIEGADKYEFLSCASLRAVANKGYKFTQWEDGNTDNPREILVYSDTTLLAIFATIGTGIEENESCAINIYAHHNVIVVENADAEIGIFDATGRCVAKRKATSDHIEVAMPRQGLYIVKVGAIATRVVVE